jgi:phosphomannomutase
MGLTIWEFMAKTGKSLKDLIQEVYNITGPFWFERNDMYIEESTKLKVLDGCKKGTYKEFGKYKVQRIEDLDGYKYFFDDNTWLMIRASGTEPVLRLYAEGDTKEIAFDILEEAKKVLLG